MLEKTADLCDCINDLSNWAETIDGLNIAMYESKSGIKRNALYLPIRYLTEAIAKIDSIATEIYDELRKDD